jgi:hypothetical protein
MPPRRKKVADQVEFTQVTDMTATYSIAPSVPDLGIPEKSDRTAGSSRKKPIDLREEEGVDRLMAAVPVEEFFGVFQKLDKLMSEMAAVTVDEKAVKARKEDLRDNIMRLASRWNLWDGFKSDAGGLSIKTPSSRSSIDETMLRRAMYDHFMGIGKAQSEGNSETLTTLLSTDAIDQIVSAATKKSRAGAPYAEFRLPGDKTPQEDA